MYASTRDDGFCVIARGSDSTPHPNTINDIAAVAAIGVVTRVQDFRAYLLSQKEIAEPTVGTVREADVASTVWVHSFHLTLVPCVARAILRFNPCTLDRRFSSRTVV